MYWPNLNSYWVVLVGFRESNTMLSLKSKEVNPKESLQQCCLTVVETGFHLRQYQPSIARVRARFPVCPPCPPLGTQLAYTMQSTHQSDPIVALGLWRHGYHCCRETVC